MTAISTGSQVGRYVVEALIARGGTGDVYRARDERLNRRVALKILGPRFAADHACVARFTQEARTTAKLNHANIIAVHDVGSHGGRPYVVSELLDGTTLRTRIRNRVLAAEAVIRYALSITRGLIAAHRLGVIHGDLKPENVFITRDERVKIVDFGIASLEISGDTQNAGTTDAPTSVTPALFIGATAYSSPEQLRGLAVDARSDIFSLGVLLYEMSAGVVPFRGNSSVEVLEAILKEDPIPLRWHNERIPAALETIVRHCLEKRPEARFQSACDLAFTLSLIAPPVAVSRRRARWRESAMTLSARIDAAATCLRRVAEGIGVV
jgi:eukaryotic-like serine/threonine-protein kinase